MVASMLTLEFQSLANATLAESTVGTDGSHSASTSIAPELVTKLASGREVESAWNRTCNPAFVPSHKPFGFFEDSKGPSDDGKFFG